MSDCIFCNIIEGKIPSKPIHKDEHIIAFHDIQPKAPVHVLIVPLKHVTSLQEVEEEDKHLLGHALVTARHIAEKLGIAKNGYKIAINNGEGAGQVVFHLHIHLIGGWKSSPKWKV